jgi:hypothetical protein
MSVLDNTNEPIFSKPLQLLEQITLVICYPLLVAEMDSSDQLSTWLPPGEEHQ